MIKELNYQDILNTMKQSVLSLDISRNSTGWILHENGKTTFGHFKSEGETNREIRQNFKKNIEEILAGRSLDLCIIEDTIQGNNYKTTKILTELNIMVEELIDFDRIKITEVVRLDNKEWKKYLNKLTNYEPQIKNQKDKVQITEALEKIGFTNEIQDIKDAMGILLGYIYNTHISQTEKLEKRRDNILTQYTIKQYTEIPKKYEKLEILNFTNKDIPREFKNYINTVETPSKEYIIKTNTMNLGIIAIKFKLKLDGDITYLYIKNKKG